LFCCELFNVFHDFTSKSAHEGSINERNLSIKLKESWNN